MYAICSDGMALLPTKVLMLTVHNLLVWKCILCISDLQTELTGITYSPVQHF